MALISTFFELNKNCKAYASSTPGSQSTIIFFMLWYLCKTEVRIGCSILNIAPNLEKWCKRLSEKIKFENVLEVIQKLTVIFPC